jgi:hypothetical protein
VSQFARVPLCWALSVTPGALSVTQRALSVTQRALSVTQRALSVTQRALSVTQRALSVTQRALSVTQRALSVTQRALTWQPGVAAGGAPAPASGGAPATCSGAARPSAAGRRARRRWTSPPVWRCVVGCQYTVCCSTSSWTIWGGGHRCVVGCQYTVCCSTSSWTIWGVVPSTRTLLPLVEMTMHNLALSLPLSYYRLLITGQFYPSKPTERASSLQSRSPTQLSSVFNRFAVTIFSRELAPLKTIHGTISPIVVSLCCVI